MYEKKLGPWLKELMCQHHIAPSKRGFQHENHLSSVTWVYVLLLFHPYPECCCHLFYQRQYFLFLFSFVISTDCMSRCFHREQRILEIRWLASYFCFKCWDLPSWPGVPVFYLEYWGVGLFVVNMGQSMNTVKEQVLKIWKHDFYNYRSKC